MQVTHLQQPSLNKVELHQGYNMNLKMFLKELNNYKGLETSVCEWPKMYRALTPREQTLFNKDHSILANFILNENYRAVEEYLSQKSPIVISNYNPKPPSIFQRFFGSLK